MTQVNCHEALLRAAHQKLTTLFEFAQQDLIARKIVASTSHLKIPTIMLGQRGKVAGSAHLQKNLIKLNTMLFKQNEGYFLEEVIVHELSHILVHQIYGRKKPHGKEWQQIMRQIFEKIPHTKHTLDVSNIGIKQVAYQCKCDTVYLSMVRHNRIIRAEQRYICKKCQQVLTVLS